jgi:hypothetical protein
MCFVLVICSVLWSKGMRDHEALSVNFEWRCEADFIKVILNLTSLSSAESTFFNNVLFICNSEDFKDDNKPSSYNSNIRVMNDRDENSET